MFLLAFTGVRGIVSLAAALAIPLVIVTGEPFPYRDLILFLTFAVILITLVGQGLMLPWVIEWLGLFQAGRKEREINRAAELQARSEAVRAAGEMIGHVHFVDSNRRPAGMGHTDFAPIVNALRETKYVGYLSVEAFPYPDSRTAAEATIRVYKRLLS